MVFWFDPLFLISVCDCFPLATEKSAYFDDYLRIHSDDRTPDTSFLRPFLTQMSLVMPTRTSPFSLGQLKSVLIRCPMPQSLPGTRVILGSTFPVTPLPLTRLTYASVSHISFLEVMCVLSSAFLHCFSHPRDARPWVP